MMCYYLLLWLCDVVVAALLHSGIVYQLGWLIINVSVIERVHLSLIISILRTRIHPDGKHTSQGCTQVSVYRKHSRSQHGLQYDLDLMLMEIYRICCNGAMHAVKEIVEMCRKTVVSLCICYNSRGRYSSTLLVILLPQESVVSVFCDVVVLMFVWSGGIDFDRMGMNNLDIKHA